MAKTIQGACVQGAINTFAGYSRRSRGRKLLKILSMDLTITPNVSGALAAGDAWLVALMNGSQSSVLLPNDNRCKWFDKKSLNAVPDQINLHWEVRNLPPFIVEDEGFTIGFNTESRAANGTDTLYYTIYYEEYNAR